MSDPVDPRSQRTSAVETSKAAPECNVNFLQQITTFVGITFIRPRKSFERRTERRSCFGIPLFLASRPVGITHSVQVVASQGGF